MKQSMETIESVVDAFEDEYMAYEPFIDDVDARRARITLHWRDWSGFEKSKVVMCTWRGDTEYIAGQLCKRLREKGLISDCGDEHVQLGENMSIDIYVTSVEEDW